MKFPIQGNFYVFYSFGTDDSKLLCEFDETKNTQQIDKSAEIKVEFPSITLFTLRIEMKKIVTHFIGKFDFFPYLASASEAKDLVLLDGNVHMKDSNGIVCGLVHFTGSVFSPDLPQKVVKKVDINFLPTPRSVKQTSNSQMFLPLTTREMRKQTTRLTAQQKSYPFHIIPPKKYPLYDKAPIKVRDLPMTLLPLNTTGSVFMKPTEFLAHSKSTSVSSMPQLRNDDSKSRSNEELNRKREKTITVVVQRKTSGKISPLQSTSQVTTETTEEKVVEGENGEKEEVKTNENENKEEKENKEEDLNKKETNLEGDEPPGEEQIRAAIEIKEDEKENKGEENENKGEENENKGEENKVEENENKGEVKEEENKEEEENKGEVKGENENKEEEENKGEVKGENEENENKGEEEENKVEENENKGEEENKVEENEIKGEEKENEEEENKGEDEKVVKEFEEEEENKIEVNQNQGEVKDEEEENKIEVKREVQEENEMNEEDVKEEEVKEFDEEVKEEETQIKIEVNEEEEEGQNVLIDLAQNELPNEEEKSDVVSSPSRKRLEIVDNIINAAGPQSETEQKAPEVFGIPERIIKTFINGTPSKENIDQDEPPPIEFFFKNNGFQEGQGFGNEEKNIDDDEETHWPSSQNPKSDEEDEFIRPLPEKQIENNVEVEEKQNEAPVEDEERQVEVEEKQNEDEVQEIQNEVPVESNHIVIIDSTDFLSDGAYVPTNIIGNEEDREESNYNLYEKDERNNFNENNSDEPPNITSDIINVDNPVDLGPPIEFEHEEEQNLYTNVEQFSEGNQVEEEANENNRTTSFEKSLSHEQSYHDDDKQGLGNETEENKILSEQENPYQIENKVYSEEANYNATNQDNVNPGSSDDKSNSEISSFAEDS